MKVLLVGGNSSVAQALKLKLATHHQVVTAGRRGCDWPLDLADPELKLPNDVDVIVHTAAHFGGKSAQEIIDAETINVSGTVRLCEAAVNAGVKHLVYVSSIFSGATPQDSNYSVYSISKKHAEELATYYCSQHQLPLTILRPSHLYGPGESFRKHQPFFYTILDKARNGEDLTLYGNNDPVRNYLYIDDLTEIINRVIDQKNTGNFACAQPADVTYSQIAKAAYDVFETSGQVTFLTDKPNIPSFKYDKSDALYAQIGFYPQIGLKQGIEKIAQNSL